MNVLTIPDPGMQRDGVSDDIEESAVMVSMVEDHVVICPPDQLDLALTEVLVVAAASVVSSGSTVMIDLDPDTASGDLVARRPVSSGLVDCVTGDGGPVTIPCAGHVRLRTRDSYWTIDLARGRLFRSDEPVETRFLVAADWTRIQALWVSPVDVVALTTSGSYVSTHAAWTSRRRDVDPVPV